MDILIAEDDRVSRELLKTRLEKWEFKVTVTENGRQALDMLMLPSAPRLAILDWMMPEIAGIDVCRELRAVDQLKGIYVILLTARVGKWNIIEGLKAGANDYIVKPFQSDELYARVQVGIRVIELYAELEQRVRELNGALSQVKKLQGLLPVCSYCKKIRDRQNQWQEIDTYISRNSEASVSHSVCPSCYSRVAAEMPRPA